MFQQGEGLCSNQSWQGESPEAQPREWRAWGPPLCLEQLRRWPAMKETRRWRKLAQEVEKLLALPITVRAAAAGGPQRQSQAQVFGVFLESVAGHNFEGNCDTWTSGCQPHAGAVGGLLPATASPLCPHICHSCFKHRLQPALIRCHQAALC